MTDIDKCREAFETWMESQPGYSLILVGRDYRCVDTRRLWTLWQAAWNAAQPKPAANTVRVRIPLVLDGNGQWYARRWDDENDSEALAGLLANFAAVELVPASWLWVTADVPKPEVAEVQGRIEQHTTGDTQ